VEIGVFYGLFLRRWVGGWVFWPWATREGGQSRDDAVDRAAAGGGGFSSDGEGEAAHTARAGGLMGSGGKLRGSDVKLFVGEIIQEFVKIWQRHQSVGGCKQNFLKIIMEAQGNPMKELGRHQRGGALFAPIFHDEEFTGPKQRGELAIMGSEAMVGPHGFGKEDGEGLGSD
jgi:hypothetical protein